MLKCLTKHNFYNIIWYCDVVSILSCNYRTCFLWNFFASFTVISLKRWVLFFFLFFYGKYGICDPVVVSMLFVVVSMLFEKKATTWQNQQNDCAPSEDSDQPGHPPSLISVFAVRMKKPWALSYPLNAQRRLWSDWADAQADLSLRWAHSHFVGFVMSWLKWDIDSFSMDFIHLF